MKDPYWGDVHDDLTFGLPRIVLSTGVPLGVCWMLTADAGGAVGDQIAYLDRPHRWRVHDPPLYDALRAAILEPDRHEVAATSWLGVLPGALFADRLLTDDRQQRSAAMAAMRRALAPADWCSWTPTKAWKCDRCPWATGGRGAMCTMPSYPPSGSSGSPC